MKKIPSEAVTAVVVVLLICAIAAGLVVLGYESGQTDTLKTECLLHGGEPILSNDEITCIDRRALIELRPALPTPMQETQP